VGWRYAAGNVQPTVSESFTGGTSFDISGVPIAATKRQVISAWVFAYAQCRRQRVI
jgi:hypothetical protein